MIGMFFGLAFIGCFCYLWYHAVRAAFKADSKSRGKAKMMVGEIEDWLHSFKG